VKEEVCGESIAVGFHLEEEKEESPVARVDTRFLAKTQIFDQRAMPLAFGATEQERQIPLVFGAREEVAQPLRRHRDRTPASMLKHQEIRIRNTRDGLQADRLQIWIEHEIPPVRPIESAGSATFKNLTDHFTHTRNIYER
jgi:hypothetical protein